jgi:hypothetical protein
MTPTNTLTAQLNFDYQGKHYNLSCVLDIDVFMCHQDFFHSVYLQIAREHNIGLYTYELEVMMDQPIVFSNELGYAKGCVNDQGEINFEQLKENYQESVDLSLITPILERFSLHQNLKKSILEAYTLGKKQAG